MVAFFWYRAYAATESMEDAIILGALLLLVFAAGAGVVMLLSIVQGIVGMTSRRWYVTFLLCCPSVAICVLFYSRLG